MFSLIFCLLPVLLALYQISVVKNRSSIDWNIKKGEICYHCKESLNIDNDVILRRLLDKRDFSQLCVSCNRDRKIDQIKKPYLKWKFKFLKFLISGKFHKMSIIFMILVFSVIILDVVLLACGFKFRLWPVYGTLNLIFYFISLYKTFYTTKKKTSE